MDKNETPYKGLWIQLSEQQDQGLFLASIRITRDAPDATTRRWTNLKHEPAVYFDFAAASQDALEQAKSHIDRAKG